MSFYNSEGECLSSTKPGEVGQKRDIWGTGGLIGEDGEIIDDGHDASEERKVKADKKGGSESDKPDADPMLFSSAAKAPAKASKPKAFPAIQNAVKTACQVKRLPMFLENTKDLTAEQWGLLYAEAKKWKENKSSTIQAWYDVFIGFCAGLKGNSEISSKFPAELQKSLADKTPSDALSGAAASGGATSIEESSPAAAPTAQSAARFI